MADIVPIKKHRDYERQTKRTAAGCLRDCRAKNPTEVLVIGYDAAGDLFVSGAPPDPERAMWLMASATKKLLGG